MKFLKVYLKKLITTVLLAILLSILIYSYYMLVTPLKLEFLPWLVIFASSFFILSLFEFFIFIVKLYMDRNK